MIQMFKPAISNKAAQYVSKTMESGMIGEGPRVEEFKEQLQKRFYSNNIILTNSGTSALTLALRLTGVAGYEVITTPFTMIATNVAIMAAGATPVFADINENNVNISVEDIKKKITKRTKAIIVVHVGGVPCDMEELKELGIPIISDAAHAFETYYHGKHISTWADYTMFSFQSIKHLNTGDGGALVVKDKAKYELGEKLKWFGMSRKVPEGMTRLEHQMTADVEDWGYKFHMNDIAASIGLANLKIVDQVIYKQTDNADFYLRNLPNLPSLPSDSFPSWWAFYLLVDKREDFIRYMANEGIETTPMWRRNDEYSVFNKAYEGLLYSKPILPNMNKLEKKIVFIPGGWWLKEKERRHIVDCIIRFNKTQKITFI